MELYSSDKIERACLDLIGWCITERIWEFSETNIPLGYWKLMKSVKMRRSLSVNSIVFGNTMKLKSCGFGDCVRKFPEISSTFNIFFFRIVKMSESTTSVNVRNYTLRET